MPHRALGRPRSSRHRSRPALARTRCDPGPTRQGRRDPLKPRSWPVASPIPLHSPDESRRPMNLGGWTARRYIWPVERPAEGALPEGAASSHVAADRASRDASITLGLTLPGDTVLYLLLPL